MLILAFHLHLHLIHVKGPGLDYVGVAFMAFLSWLISFGPGEPVLITAAVFASKHKLDITPLVFWAWIGASLGGVVGWLVGMKAGRTLLTARGPLRGLRLAAVHRGEKVFKRMEVLAILMTPSWIAGIHGARARLYLPTNFVSALLLWAAPLGIGAYYAGPPILDLFDDAGTAISVVVIAVVVGVIVATVLHRVRRTEAT